MIAEKIMSDEMEHLAEKVYKAKLKVYYANLQQENKQLKEEIDKLDNYIEQIRKMLYKRHLDDYDLYTANVLCDMQSDFEEILRGEY